MEDTLKRVIDNLLDQLEDERHAHVLTKLKLLEYEKVYENAPFHGQFGDESKDTSPPDGLS